MTQKTRRWKVSYEIETVDHEWLDGGEYLYHRVPRNAAAPGAGLGGIHAIPADVVVEDITPVTEYPNGTVIRRGPDCGSRGGTYIKHGGVWHYAGDGSSAAPIVAAHDEDGLRRLVGTGGFILIHRPE